MRILQVLSGLTTTHAFTSVPGTALRLVAAVANGRLKPSARPEPAIAVLTMNWRRERLVALSLMIFVMIVLLTPALCFYGWRGRRMLAFSPPSERRRARADTCRSGRYWSSLRRCPCR